MPSPTAGGGKVGAPMIDMPPIRSYGIMLATLVEVNSGEKDSRNLLPEPVPTTMTVRFNGSCGAPPHG